MIQDSEPKYLRQAPDANGNVIGGVCGEIIQAMMRVDPSLRITFDPEPVPFRRIEKSLEDGEIDAFFGMIRNAEREAKFVFLEPRLYATYNKLVVNANDEVAVEDWDDVRRLGAQGVVMVDAGTAHQRYLEEQGNLILDFSGKTREDNLRKLLRNRARFYYSTDLGVVFTMRQLGIEPQLRLLPRSFKDDAQYLALSKRLSPEIISRANAALIRLHNSGELAAIRARH